MLRSMTGFGKADCNYDGDLVTIEVSAVNHRFLDCSTRLSYAWASLEPVVKELVGKHISRGKINVNVNRKRGTGERRQSIMFDADIAKQYIDASRDLVQMLGSMETLKLETLARLDGVFYQEEPEDDLDKAQAMVLQTLSQALERLNTMRVTEGRALEQEVAHRIDLMRQALSVIEQRLPELNRLYEERLRARVDDLKGDLELSEDRIAMEVALVADKGDVTEEVVRLKTHFAHASELLTSNQPVGRELNFLSQELQREVNTLGSKVRDADVTKEVLKMKSELERLREQIQNIE